MNTICTKCAIEMTYISSITVANHNTPTNLVEGDKYKCLKCRIEVVVPFGKEFEGNNPVILLQDQPDTGVVEMIEKVESFLNDTSTDAPPRKPFFKRLIPF